MIAIFSDQTLEDVAAVVGEVVGVQLKPCESTYYGDLYYSASPESELKLTLNQDPVYRPGDSPDERFFARDVPDARFVPSFARREAHSR